MDIRVNGHPVKGMPEQVPNGVLDRLKDHPPLGPKSPEYYGLRTDSMEVVVVAKDLPDLGLFDTVTVDGKKAKVVFDIQNPNNPPEPTLLQRAKEKITGFLGLLLNPPISDPAEVFESHHNGPA